MARKRKTNRGANLVGVGCPANARKRTADQIDRTASDGEAEFVPEEEQMDDDGMRSSADVVPEEAEPGEKRRARREAVLAEKGPAGLARLDAQAERQRRCRRTQADAADRSAQTSIEDAVDGTLLAKKAAQELEPEDAWAPLAVAVGEAVATDGNGERVVFLGEAMESVDQGASNAAAEVAAAPPRRGRPPGPLQKSPGRSYASHKGLGPSSTGNPTTSKKERRAAREAASLTAQHYTSSGRAPGDGPPKKRRADADVARGEQLLPKLLGELRPLADRLCAIASARQFQRSDFTDGELLSHGDWVELRESSWELRRVYAMAHFVVLQRKGVGVVAACTQAAEAVRLGKKAHGMTMPAVHHWLSEYIKNKGRIASSRHGCHAKTESFLTDESIKETALSWLRANVRSAQAKGSAESPLNVPR